jgi:predicted DNA-binding ribbon-helix-helix protein
LVLSDISENCVFWAELENIIETQETEIERLVKKVNELSSYVLNENSCNDLDVDQLLDKLLNSNIVQKLKSLANIPIQFINPNSPCWKGKIPSGPIY